MGNKRYMTTVAVVIGAMVILGGCSKPIAEETAIGVIMNEIKGETEIAEGVEENLTEQKNAEKYGISANAVAEGEAYYSTAEGKADKIILVRAASSEDVEGIEQALAAEMTGITAAWEDNERESQKIENGLLKTKDDCVILAISDDVEEIEEIFDDML